MGEWPSLALDSNGDAHISYSDTFNGRLRYAQKAYDFWYLNTLDYTSGAGKFSDLAVDDQDGVHIGYINENNHNLSYIKIPDAQLPELPEVVNSY
ncbi:MAG: hypothetical protein GWN61_21255, partial [candidate division Zixibacteria bacterium]|nr:hypothetical protein [candidate division Zixibacteria bacterium]NIS48394.1 hypothetical protein [candidate division Zixibacteria bacterium]NIU16517.1 hypothetical protein [candidate division Zixibacteria bacterium]NIV08633.1 hypothetical protein [candidate division Zixibacteria bacterium]